MFQEDRRPSLRRNTSEIHHAEFAKRMATRKAMIWNGSQARKARLITLQLVPHPDVQCVSQRIPAMLDDIFC
jgi:hypothetical protein